LKFNDLKEKKKKKKKENQKKKKKGTGRQGKIRGGTVKEY